MSAAVFFWRAARRAGSKELSDMVGVGAWTRQSKEGGGREGGCDGERQLARPLGSGTARPPGLPALTLAVVYRA